jgi:hypothetical protein
MYKRLMFDKALQSDAKLTSDPIYRWRVGEIEIARVLEFEAALFEPTMRSLPVAFGTHHRPRTRAQPHGGPTSSDGQLGRDRSRPRVPRLEELAVDIEWRWYRMRGP